jgi:hypothetical protein
VEQGKSSEEKARQPMEMAVLMQMRMAADEEEGRRRRRKGGIRKGLRA